VFVFCVVYNVRGQGYTFSRCVCVCGKDVFFEKEENFIEQKKSDFENKQNSPNVLT